MNDDTRQELQALEELAAPYRFKVGLTIDGEAVIFGCDGVIEWCSYDNQTFAAYSSRVSTIKKLLGLPWVRKHQHGDKELRVVFPRDMFFEMTGILKLKKKRELPTHLTPFLFEPRVQSQNQGQIAKVLVSS